MPGQGLFVSSVKGGEAMNWSNVGLLASLEDRIIGLRGLFLAADVQIFVNFSF